MKMLEYTNFSKYRNISWSKWIWPGILAGSAAIVIILYAADLHTPLRPIFVLWFLLVCPGMSVARIFDVQENLLEWVLALTLSVSLAGIISTIMIYTSTWSTVLGLSILVGITLLGVVIQSLLNLRVLNWPVSEISMPLDRTSTSSPAPVKNNIRNKRTKTK